MFSDSGNAGDEGTGEIPDLNARENAGNRGTIQLISNLDTGGR
jgi:SLT domain-containing protein